MNLPTGNHTLAKGFLLPVIQGGAPEFEQVNGAALEEGDVFYSINAPALPVTSIFRLYQTMRTKSTALYQVYFSFNPRVASWTRAVRVKP